MIKRITYILLVLATLTTASVAGTAETPAPIQPAPAEDLGFTVSIGYDTHYLYRGLEVGEDIVWGSVDWSIPLTDTVSLYAGAWYLSAEDGSGFSELDLTAGVSVDLGAVQVAVGYTRYEFFDVPTDDIDDVGIKISTTVGPVDLYAAGHYDFTAEGCFFAVGASTTVKVNDWLSLVPYSSISFGTNYYPGFNLPEGGRYDGFRSVIVGLKAPIELADRLILTPYIAGHFPLDDLADNQDDLLYGGVSLSFSF